MAGRTAFDLDVDEIVHAAIEIFREQGLDAVSMRSVSARLGVSPVPLYNRVGNKASLLDAMADHLLADVAPTRAPEETWQRYATRWAAALRDRLSRTSDVRMLIGERRAPYVQASRPLMEALRADGFDAGAALQACRLLIWATVGFVVVETRRPPGDAPRPRRRGGGAGGVTKAEADALFDQHVRYLIEGLEGDTEVAGER